MDRRTGTIRSLDGYSLADWGLAFTATAGAAAALTGLLFVALSINLRQIIAIAIAVSAVTARIQLRTDRKALGISALAFGSRIVGAQTGPVFLVIGAVSLLAQTGGGLYWVVPALLAMIVVSIIGAWVMLVEILR